MTSSFMLLLVCLDALGHLCVGDGDVFMCKDGVNCTETQRPPSLRPRPKKPDNPENYFLVPPFLIGAATVIVLYVIFHCIYMHCYTDSRVKKVARKIQRPPTIIVHDDMNTGTSQQFTPMVKIENADGENEIVEAQPFLVCQPLDTEEDDYNGYPSRRDSIFKNLQVPKLFSRRSSRASLSDEASSPSEDKPNLEKTRASICFVPVGKTLSDPSTNTNTEWTPLQGFVYSSFVLSRNPSYKHACGRTSTSSINSEVVVLPRKASYCRSLSQSSAGEDEQELLYVKQLGRSSRKNSRVSFNFVVDQLKEEDDEEKET